MNARPIPYPVRRLLIASIVLAAATPATHAQTSLTSEIRGVVQVAAPALSDTILSTPLGRTAVWTGAVASVAGSRIAVYDTPDWDADRFVRGGAQHDTFYVRVLTGALRGHFFTVAANDAASLLVDSAGLDLSRLAAGDELEIAPYWTLGTLYPAADAGKSFIASPTADSPQTELFFFNPAVPGLNAAPTLSYFFYDGAWRKTGESPSASFDNAVVLPDTYFLHRNKKTGTTLAFAGRVLAHSLSTVLEAAARTRRDNHVALAFPVDVTLRRSELASAVSPTTSANAITDRVLLYNPAATGINRSPTASYFYYKGGWRKEGASLAKDFNDSVKLPSAGGFVVRKASDSTTSIWTFETGLE